MNLNKKVKKFMFTHCFYAVDMRRYLKQDYDKLQTHWLISAPTT